MNKSITCSVCIASYNGGKYIEEQIDSIIRQLDVQDEVIVSDDGSADDTCRIVARLKQKFDRIFLVQGPRKGFACNFGNAIDHAKNDIILLSDQDDIWEPDKVSRVKEAFLKDPLCTTVLHEMSTFRKNEGNDTKEIRVCYHSGFLRNFVKSSYWGCCMAVKRDFTAAFLPFRDHCVGHDQLIGLMTEKHGKTCFVKQPLIRHRLHDTNTSGKRSVWQMIVFRVSLWRDYLIAENLYCKNN